MVADVAAAATAGSEQRHLAFAPGQRLDPVATRQRRRAHPSGTFGELGRTLLGGGRQPRLEPMAVHIGQLGGRLGRHPQRVDRLVGIDRLALELDVAVDERPGVERVRRGQWAVDHLGQHLEPLDRLARHAEPGEIVEHRRLQGVHGVVTRDRDQIADPVASRDQVAAAGIEPGPGPLARADRGGDRAESHGIGLCERRRRLVAVAEQQVALGDADVCPHEGCVLTDLGRHLGHLAEATNRLVTAPGVAGDLGEGHVEPHPRSQRARCQRPLDRRFEQLAAPRRSSRHTPVRVPR